MISHKDLSAVLRRTYSVRLWRHTVAVAELARELALVYKWDSELAYRAGLVHDWAKGWSVPKLIKYIRANKVKVPDLSFAVQWVPEILHGYVAAVDVRKRGWLTDKTALAAVAHHTLGNSALSLPEKILYVADIAARDRTFNGARQIRRIAQKNLNAAFVTAVALKMSYLLCRGRPLHPMTVNVWNEALRP